MRNVTSLYNCDMWLFFPFKDIGGAGYSVSPACSILVSGKYGVTLSTLCQGDEKSSYEVAGCMT